MDDLLVRAIRLFLVNDVCRRYLGRGGCGFQNNGFGLGCLVSTVALEIVAVGDSSAWGHRCRRCELAGLISIVCGRDDSFKYIAHAPPAYPASLSQRSHGYDVGQRRVNYEQRNGETRAPCIKLWCIGMYPNCYRTVCLGSGSK